MNAVCGGMSLELGRLSVTIGRLAIGQDVKISVVLLVLAHGIQRRIMVVVRRLTLRAARDLIS